MVLETVQTVPLTQWEDGSIRVKGSRLLIDTVISAHDRGECPEEIYQSFPSSSYSVADIYSVIAYYLSHKAEIDSYLLERESEAEKIWEKIEAESSHIAFREELKKRKEEYFR